MDIYQKNYRKIWVERHGPIPLDENGRTYEIHHIDGDHSFEPRRRSGRTLESNLVFAVDRIAEFLVRTCA